VRRATAIILVLGAAVTALIWATVATSSGWPDRLAEHLSLFIIAGVAWLALCLALPRLPHGRGQLAGLLLCSVLARVPAWAHPPMHSDDAYRYLWDGRVQRAGVNPYRHAPEAPELGPLRDDDWARINNRGLRTVYPPLAEEVFALAAALPLPSLWAWKLLCAAADLGVLALLVRWLLRRKADPRAMVVWGLCPLGPIELAMNGHIEAVGVVLMVAALEAAERRREDLSAALLGAASAIKLLPILLLPGLVHRGSMRRGAMVFALTCGLLAAPYLGAGSNITGSLGEYGRRWRANDGVFAILYEGVSAAITRSPIREGAHPGSLLSRLITGRDRDTVYADEAANFLARGAVLALCLWVVWLAARSGLPPVELAEVALGSFLLLSPTLHPWYVLWILPLCALGAAPAWLLLAALSPLGYVPLSGWLSTGTWRDPVWTRLVEHGAVWLCLALTARRQITLTRR
jgi:hypothetical protein